MTAVAIEAHSLWCVVAMCAVVCRAVKSLWRSVFSSLMINCACGLSAGSMSIFVWRIAAFCCFISSKISDRERPEYSILVLLHA